MSLDLSDQVNLANSFNASLSSLVEESSSFTSSYQNQIAITQQLNQSLQSLNLQFESLSNNLQTMSNRIESTSFENSSSSRSQTEEFNREAKKVTNNLSNTKNSTEQISEDYNKQKNIKNRETEILKNQEKNLKKFQETSKVYAMVDSIFDSVLSTIDNIIDNLKKLAVVRRALQTGGWSLLYDIPVLIIKSLIGVMGSIIGAATNFFKNVMSLPMMVAGVVVQWGNAFREDIIETIGNAYQSTKEMFDAHSAIGKGMTNLKNIGVGALKELANPRSMMVKLFGSGASAAAEFISTVSKVIDDMGSVADLIGPQVSNSRESAEFLVVSMRTLGMTNKDVAYYALDSAVNVGNINDLFDEVRSSIIAAAKRNNVDTKASLEGFHKLRTDIKDFGHLSSQNIANLVTNMRRLNVNADDLAGIFSKFTSFEEASKTSAMLYQSFGMSVDALSLLTAQDPGQIVNQLRDAMFATGKSYEQLNRHEKQLLQSTTGMKDSVLKGLMSYNSMHMSYEDVRNQMTNSDPTEKQIKAIKSVTSSIKQIQKIMQFKTPFDAFVQGLMKNVKASSSVTKISMSLSRLYEDLYLFGLNLDYATIRGITTPMILIVNKVNEIFKSEAFRSLLSTGTSIFSNVANFITGGITGDKSYIKAQKAIDDVFAVAQTKSKTVQTDRQAMLASIEKSLIGKNKEVLNFLKRKNILDKNNKFIKGATLETVLSTIKSGTLLMETKAGKASIKKLAEDVDVAREKFILNYISIDDFKNNRGITGIIKRTSDQFKSLYNSGKSVFGPLFDLGRKMMGAIIKGAAIGLTSLLYVLSGQIDQLYKGISSPIQNYMNKYIRGSGSTGDYTLLNYLGIEPADAQGISDSLVEALTGFVKRTPKLFSLAGTVLTSIYKVFTELAGGVLSAIGTMLAAAYDSQNAAVRTYLDLFYQEDITNARVAQTKLASKKGLLGLAGLAKKRRETNEDYWFTQSFAFTDLAPLTDFWLDFSQAEGKKASLSQNLGMLKFLRSGNKAVGDALAENTEWHDLSASKRGFNYSMSILKEIDRIKQYKKVEKKYNIIESNKYKNLGYDLNDPNTKLIIQQLVANSASSEFKFDEMDYNHYYDTAFSGFGTLDEIKASENFEKYSMHIHNMKDGMFESGINSVLAQDGLKIFTEDNKIIVPHSMDELARLSGDDKTSLISVFRSIGQAHQIIATSSVIMNKGLLNRKDTNYPKEKSEAVKKALIAAKEVLQAVKSKKVSIRNTSIGVGE